MTAYGNLFQGQQNFTIIVGRHTIKTGGEVRLNRDTTYFGISPNGEYDFGGGTAYSPVDIPRKAERTTSRPARRSLTHSPRCSPEGHSSTPSRLRLRIRQAEITSAPPPSPAMPAASMRKTPGRSPTASSSITAFAGRFIRPSPNAPNAPPAS